MNPILYSSTETKFDTNGKGFLSDAIRCIVTEERNGAFELEMEYPLGGAHFSEIEQRSIIFAKPNPVEDEQPFRVYRMTKPIDGRVLVYAAHISYDLSGVPLSPFTASSAAAAMSRLKTYAAIDSPFSFWTDKTTSSIFSVNVPSSTRAMLGGQHGSILDVYGGEYKFDRFLVRLYAQRGMNRGVSIRYGKNLTSFEQDENCSNVYTGVYPYWADAEGNVIELPEKIVNAEGTYGFEKIMPLDVSSDFEEAPTDAQLREKAKEYIDENEIGIPKVSIDISFVQLEQTEEYKNIAMLERVLLCDTVNVEFPEMGVSATAKCTKTEYDVLLDRYQLVSIGDARYTIADTIVDQDKKIKEKPDRNFLQAAILSLTSDILGAKGGAVRLLDTDGDDVPDTLYIADHEDPLKAIKVWRFNYEGWGASENGYNGPFVLGASLNTGIVADFITTGSLNAALIKAGVLQSFDGKTFYLDLEAGVLKMNASTLSIAGKTVEDLAEELAKDAADDAIDSQTQADIFNKLTNNGEIQGLFMQNNQLYVNASYINTGTLNASNVSVINLNASNITSGTLAAARIDVENLKVKHLDGADGTFTGRVTAGEIESNNYAYTSGTFADSGLRIDLTNGGIASKNFAIFSDGSAFFRGELRAASGTFSGSLSAATGTFSGSLSAATGTFSGSLSAADGTFTGELQAAKGTFSGDLSAAGGTFEGKLSAATGTFSGSLSAADGTFTNLIGTQFVKLGDRVVVDTAGLTLLGSTDSVRIYMNPPTATGGTEARWVERDDPSYGSVYSLGIYTSKRSEKKDIEKIGDECSEIIDGLNPVYFRFTHEESTSNRSVGFIADETDLVCKAITAYASSGEPIGVQYSNIAAILTAEIQRLRKRVLALEEKTK